MVGEDGRVRVMDFGLALADLELIDESCQLDALRATIGRLTQTATVLGTPAYMCLEQLEARDVDARSVALGRSVSAGPRHVAAAGTMRALVLGIGRRGQAMLVAT